MNLDIPADYEGRKWLTVKEVARILRVSANSVRGWTRKGLIQHILIESTLRYPWPPLESIRLAGRSSDTIERN